MNNGLLFLLASLAALILFPGTKITLVDLKVVVGGEDFVFCFGCFFYGHCMSLFFSHANFLAFVAHRGFVCMNGTTLNLFCI